jgi:hypothetical protein
MKKSELRQLIKEEVYRVSEISGAYANRAKNKANSSIDWNDDDVANRTLKVRQFNKFGNYVNPEIKDFAKRLGFNGIYNHMGVYQLEVTQGANHELVEITDEGKIRSQYLSNFDSNLIKRLQRLAKAIKDDNTDANEL